MICVRVKSQYIAVLVRHSSSNHESNLTDNKLYIYVYICST